jgi:IclR family KDG regulon transcriptional repressor
VTADRKPLSLEILWYLAHAPEPATLAAITRATGYSRATLDRTLQRLCQAGWILAEGRPRRYSVSMRLALMGAVILGRSRVREIVLRHARELAQAVQNPVVLAYYDDGDSVFTDAIEVRGDRVTQLITGRRLPAIRTAAGKILLAFQPDEEIERVARRGAPRFTQFGETLPDAIVAEIHAGRERGYATMDRELTLHGAGVAVPVFDHSNQAVAAIGLPVAAPLDGSTLDRLLPAARLTASRASVDLQHRPLGDSLVS